MKKLLIILHDLGAGGAEKMMARLAGALVDAGNDVTLLMLTGGGVHATQLDPRVKKVELQSPRSARAVPALARFLRANRFDAQLAALTHVNVVAIAAAALSGTLARLHVSERNAFSHDKYVNPAFMVRVAYLVAPLLYRLIPNPVICVSRGVAQDLVKTTIARHRDVTVADNPVLDNDFRHKRLGLPVHYWLREKSGPVIVAVGRLAPQKGFDTLIAAFAALPDTGARLVIFGEGALRAQLQAQAKTLGVADRFDLPGYTRDPMAEVAAADCFVLSSRFEGSPNALVEALSTGTPVVSTLCPHGPQDILIGGIVAPLVPVDDPLALAQAITLQLSTPRDLQRQSRIDAAARFMNASAVQTYLAALLGRPLP
ncbi:N-acetylgalactosamine-N, N'-diacetylbacillosaminyl-diphospho-undecaprenol 4-alpha-N-acetylgalactosaminyltransferase [Pseudomonas fluorescens]|uniref:N-acetylgalactosamine-N, N'-diacetylbacillosaminyl-diphospho-undecaprenol 4-alpha-N-acetylgalactosaminyltransferase n=1 Tax=Pseudomonas fluorescens TaxID=294 RepID=A0A5E7S799_PSEFL|nr:glycosyltransferase [Pseudomonas fluorescens]VVP82015.1 N-acetylgalactosamine-N, N'-diacetylbacillosaminyl-diphospho-undecaprenol 4-alpha-N-acetylgalactosaminyltransferase [Pseudomonas fluorescens]